jgi:Eco57I restriction-modification methylase/MmeI, target recognition domain
VAGDARLMTNADERFHEDWLGMVQPVDGLVVSVPVLVDAQCASRQPPELQQRLVELCDPVDANGDPGGDRAIADLPVFLTEILGWQPANVMSGDALPETLSLYVPEGEQTIRPTLALRAAKPDDPPVVLVWDLGPDCVGLVLDKPESKTGKWEYPVAAKFDRLLRHTKIPIGVLTNRTHVSLCYAPHGESSGSITFRVADMAAPGGRPILDAFVMLLGAPRLYGVAPERQLPAILAESRKRQANVTNDLADQVFDALQILLRGFEAAAERDGRTILDAAYALPGDHLYGGLLTQLLRLVFVLYAEDRGLLPVEHPVYAGHMSVLGLFDDLQADHGAHPDSMSRRFGAYARLVALFRAIYLGVEHDGLQMPARRGALFSPHEHPFLEGWEGDPGSAPINDPVARAAVRVPSVDDGTVFRVLEKLLVLKRQRLSYRALDVEQIGSVYEALMGYHVWRLPAEAVCLRGNRVWITADELLEEMPATRVRWLQDTAGLARAQADKVAKAVAGVKKAGDALEALEAFAVAGQARLLAGRLVIQPGPERRRTSSHYTPRSLTTPIVQKTLEPLFRAMGEKPPAERILNLKICDPAMGSGAFLVEACRYLGDQVVLAWTREGRHDLLAGKEDATLLARRLVAQRCLYGVDKNPFAVNLAKLSLWLVTLAKDMPFTFLDHGLRHGDSLVGLSFDQITSFHWKPAKQLELARKELEETLNEAIRARQRILELAADPTPAAQREKEWLLRDAEDALDRVRLLGDLVVGAFFSAESDKEREKERDRRLDMVSQWLREGGPPGGELVELREASRARVPAFHWMAEFPEVFWAKRPDPLDGEREGGRAWIDAFVGNPPFAGKNIVAEMGGSAMVDWLKALHEGAHGNSDYSAHFFRRASELLGNHGTIGLIATNTIAQGDTRATGLQWLVRDGLVIRDAVRSMPWPGEAAVTVSVVHLEKGMAVDSGTTANLDGADLLAINSRLRPGAERDDPHALGANAALSFIGSYVLGTGFVLTPEERDTLVRSNAANAKLILPYINGQELNTKPSQDPDRFIINFGDMPFEQAGRWPDLLSILRERVKPERDRNNRETYRKYWWQYAEKRSELMSLLPGRKRCLVTALSGKHRCFSFQPTDRVLDQTLIVFLIDNHTCFAILSSRTHSVWATLLSATLKADQRYTPSECFETFPFSNSDPGVEIPALDEIGQRLYEARTGYMLKTQQGLTQTYNLLKDADCHDPEIVALRDLHLEMDRQVLAAYGWSDIAVPPYTTPASEAEKRAFSLFEDTVIDRLFALNAERAEAERLAGRSKAKSPAKEKATDARRSKVPKARSRQLSLTDDD